MTRCPLCGSLATGGHACATVGRLIESARRLPKPPSMVDVCSFCGKHAREVANLVAGPAVYICDECIDLCIDIIGTKAERAAQAPAGSAE